MLHEIKLYFTEVHMQKLVLSVFLILFLIPFPQGFSQVTDNAPTLTVTLRNETPFVYQDSEGYTVVVGAVDNNNSLTPVTNVIIQVNFYDDFDPSPLEVIQGSTILDVIPKNGQSPFVIRSETPNPDISEVSVSLLGFDSSVPKQKGLTVYSSEVLLDTSFRFSGVLQNGGAPSAETKVHLAFYDNFEPPQILGVSTIELGNMFLNSEIAFEIDEQINSRAVGFLLFAESSVFHSDFVDVKIPLSQVATKLVTISDVSVEDTMGNKLSELKVDSIVNIKSKIWIQFAADQESNETAYTYYVQIKESGQPPYVEFIGKSDGRFIGTGPESQTIDWVPEKKGLFFIETFVWDRNNIPIAEQGPIALIIVN
jgi:L-fucose mutarotase/ribose pyranase (RbsD/FucU family)